MDKGHVTTEKQLLTMEKKLTGIYSRANKEIGKKLKEYLAEQEKKGDALLNAIKGAKSPEERAKAEAAYKSFLSTKTLQSEHFKALSEQYANELLRVNETAADYINGRMPEVYALNYNAVGGDISSKVKGYSFEMVDASTVKSLATKEETLLPYKTVNGKKDVRWNTKAVNSEIMQGILQGESIPDISKRLQHVTEMNLTSAIRNARTSTTSAQNRGRMDSYHRAEDMGIRLVKVWMATNDPRTREEHVELDGQEREIDEPFENSLGKIMYPGDPDADPANVYNCRCTLVTKVLGFEGQAVEEAQEDHENDYVTQINELQKKVEQEGLKEEYIMQAGQVMQDELTPVYEEKAKELAEAEEKQAKAYVEYREASNKFDEEFDKRYEDKSLRQDPEYLKKCDRLHDEMGDKYERWRKLNTEYKIAKGEISNEASAKILKDKLSEVRPVGASDFNLKKHLGNSQSVVRKNIEYAYNLYPTSWVEKSVDYGKLLPRKVSRGYYNGSTIAISGVTTSSMNGTAIHELGHRFEDAVPGLKAAEAKFYARRTKGEEAKWLGPGYDRYEVTRKDNFVHSYMGKDYGGNAFELVSMGFEYAYSQPLELAKDKDMQQWILGLLTLVP